MALIRGVATDGKDVSFKSEDVLYAVRLSSELPADGKHTTRLFTREHRAQRRITEIDLAHPFAYVRDTLAAAERKLMVTTMAKHPTKQGPRDASVIFNRAYVREMNPTSVLPSGCAINLNDLNRQNNLPPANIRIQNYPDSEGERFWVPYNQARVQAVLDPLPPPKTWPQRQQEPEFSLSDPPSPPDIPDLGDLIRQHIPTIDGPKCGFNRESILKKWNWPPSRRAQSGQPNLSLLREGKFGSHVRGSMGKRLTAATHTVPGLKR